MQIVDNQQKVQASKSAEKIADTAAPLPRSLLKLSPPIVGPIKITATLEVSPVTTAQPTPLPPTTPTPEVTPAPPPDAQAGDYAPIAVINDASCSGSYILGQVQNPDGAPVAGVRLAFVYQWGNRGEADSK